MRIVSIILMLVLVIPSFSQVKTYEMSELGRPAIFLVAEGKMFVLEGASVLIYSLKDFSLIKKFGRKGEGPKEFITRPFGPPMSMSMVNGQLAINSMNKISYFTLNGEFVKLTKTQANLVFYPVKNNFVVIGPSGMGDNPTTISFNLLDPKFNLLKTLHTTDVDTNMQKINLPLGALTYRSVYKDKIYIVPDNNQFLIEIYDAMGKKLSEIKKSYNPIKIPADFKKEAVKWFKNDLVFKNFFERIKNAFVFKKNFPVFRDIHIADDTLCGLTYKRKGNLWECIIMDLKGKEKNRVFIPLSSYEHFSYYPLLYSVHKNKLYTLAENEDTESWEVNILDIGK